MNIFSSAKIASAAENSNARRESSSPRRALFDTARTARFEADDGRTQLQNRRRRARVSDASNRN